MPSAADLIRILALQPHPEGGWYRETYRAPLTVDADALPERFGASRSLSTSILYLLERGDVSRLHRLHADEQWFHLEGGALEISMFDETGALSVQLLGKNYDDGEVPHAHIPACSWFGVAPADGAAWTLASCITAPGFDFDDFEMGHRDLLLAQYPQHADLIRRLT